MAIPSRLQSLGRWLGWALLAGAGALALGGCTARDETNPFTGPNGDSLSTPFG